MGAVLRLHWERFCGSTVYLDTPFRVLFRMLSHASKNRSSLARLALLVLAMAAVVPLAGAGSMRHLRLEKSAPADSSSVETRSR